MVRLSNSDNCGVSQHKLFSASSCSNAVATGTDGRGGGTVNGGGRGGGEFERGGGIRGGRGGRGMKRTCSSSDMNKLCKPADTSTCIGESTVRPTLEQCILMVNEQERQHLVQAARCRSAARRMLILERLYNSRDQYHSSLLPPAITREVAAWRGCGAELQALTHQLRTGAAATISKILDNGAIIPQELLRASTPAKQPPRLAASVEQPVRDLELEARLARRKWQQPYRDTSRMFCQSIPAGDTPLPQHLEDRFRVGTWADIPIYGVSRSMNGGYEYAQGTELHLIWDVDQSKLVGEGTNDVELVLKCVLWWKEELKHDEHFVPKDVDEPIRSEFKQFCQVSFCLCRCVHVFALTYLLARTHAHQRACMHIRTPTHTYYSTLL